MTLPYPTACVESGVTTFHTMFESTIVAGGMSSPAGGADASGTEPGIDDSGTDASIGAVWAGTAESGTEPVLPVVGNVSVATDESPVRANWRIVNAVPKPVAATSMIAFTCRRRWRRRRPVATTATSEP